MKSTILPNKIRNTHLRNLNALSTMVLTTTKVTTELYQEIKSAIVIKWSSWSARALLARSWSARTTRPKEWSPSRWSRTKKSTTIRQPLKPSCSSSSRKTTQIKLNASSNSKTTSCGATICALYLTSMQLTCTNLSRCTTTKALSMAWYDALQSNSCLPFAF